jgi:predicted transcriptional regulator
MDIGTLHPLEKALLLKVSKRNTVEQLCKATGLNKDKVMRAVQWLHEKKLVSIDEKPRQKVILTKIGRSYLKSGLPEKSFLRAALDVDSLAGIRKVSRLSKKEFNASMGLLRKKGFIEIARGKVKVTAAGRRFYKEKKIEKLFSRVSKGAFLDELADRGTVRLMLKRGIFSSDEKVMRHI